MSLSHSSKNVQADPGQEEFESLSFGNRRSQVDPSCTVNERVAELTQAFNRGLELLDNFLTQDSPFSEKLLQRLITIAQDPDFNFAPPQVDAFSAPIRNLIRFGDFDPKFEAGRTGVYTNHGSARAVCEGLNGLFGFIGLAFSGNTDAADRLLDQTSEKMKSHQISADRAYQIGSAHTEIAITLLEIAQARDLDFSKIQNRTFFPSGNPDEDPLDSNSFTFRLVEEVERNRRVGDWLIDNGSIMDFGQNGLPLSPSYQKFLLRLRVVSCFQPTEDEGVVNHPVFKSILNEAAGFMVSALKSGERCMDRGRDPVGNLVSELDESGEHATLQLLRAAEECGYDFASSRDSWGFNLLHSLPYELPVGVVQFLVDRGVDPFSEIRSDSGAELLKLNEQGLANIALFSDYTAKDLIRMGPPESYTPYSEARDRLEYIQGEIEKEDDDDRLEELHGYRENFLRVLGIYESARQSTSRTGKGLYLPSSSR